MVRYGYPAGGQGHPLAHKGRAVNKVACSECGQVAEQWNGVVGACSACLAECTGAHTDPFDPEGPWVPIDIARNHGLYPANIGVAVRRANKYTIAQLEIMAQPSKGQVTGLRNATLAAIDIRRQRGQD